MTGNTNFGNHLSKGVVLLLAIETVIAFGSVYLASFILTHFGIVRPIGREILLSHALFFTTFIILSLVSVGLYKHQLRGTFDLIVLQILVGLGFAAIALSVIYYLIPYFDMGRYIMALADLFTFFGSVVSHGIFISVFNQDTFKRRILLYGAGEKALNLLERMQRKADRRLFIVVGCFPAPGETIRITNEKVLDPIHTDLREFCHAQRVDEIVVIPDERRKSLPLDMLLKMRLDGIRASDGLTFYEQYMGKLKTDIMSPSSIIFSSGFELRRYNQVQKRMLDCILSLIMLLIVWPFILIAALAIWFEDGPRSPVFYRQIRIGLNGHPFRILKLRSMRVDAEANGIAQWANTNDHRITHVGAFLRKYRIDELPQLVNVLFGDMSLVGPRPERPEFVETLRQKIKYYELRHCVRPGITGWAQLSYPYGSTERDTLEKLQFDLYYVKNASLILDLYILLGTVEVILLSKGGR